jgi:hypothetical protein
MRFYSRLFGQLLGQRPSFNTVVSYQFSGLFSSDWPRVLERCQFHHAGTSFLRHPDGEICLFGPFGARKLAPLELKIAAHLQNKFRV